VASVYHPVDGGVGVSGSSGVILPEGVRRLFVLVSVGYWAIALWWVDRIGLLLNLRNAAAGDGEETYEAASYGPPLERLHDQISSAQERFGAVFSSQPFFVFFILLATYIGTCVLLFSVLWLLDGFRQDRPVSVGSRRHSG